MAIDVSKRLEERISAKLEAGDYSSADELLADALTSLDEQAARRKELAIREALQIYLRDDKDPGPPKGVSLEEWTARREAMVGKVRADIAEATASAERGESTDGERFFDDLDAELLAQEQQLAEG